MTSCATTASRSASAITWGRSADPPLLERLHPRPHLDLKRPGIARLTQDIEVGLSNGIRVECAVGALGWIRVLRTADSTVDDEMRHVDPFGAELPCCALCQAA